MNRITQTPEEYYSRHGCETYTLQFMFWLIVMLVLIFAVVKCENDNSNCWECEIQTTWKFPGQNPYQVSQTNNYLFCDYNDEYIERFEQCNTWSDSLTTQKAECRKQIK